MDKIAASDLVVGEKYKWNGRSEVLVYVGKKGRKDNRHQFAKESQPRNVWIEVLTIDLCLIQKAS